MNSAPLLLKSTPTQGIMSAAPLRTETNPGTSVHIKGRGPGQALHLNKTVDGRKEREGVHFQPSIDIPLKI